MTRESSPWRQPIVWLMLALVGASIIGSFWLLKLAANGDSIDAVPDEVQRTGQAQQTDLGPDARAVERRLSAVMRIDAKGGFIEVLPVSGDFIRNDPLRLHLHHPLREADDLVLDLTPTELGWRADARPADGHDWNLQLEPADGTEWRLRGRLPRSQAAAHLRPALDEAQP